MNTEEIALQVVIPDEYKGLRLDNALVQLFPAYSRARLQKWIKKGDVSVDGKILRSKDIVLGGEKVVLIPEQYEETQLIAEDVHLNIVFEDETMLVVNKPANMVVHPGAGNENGTLANGLLHHLPELKTVPRAGIVHRLDKDTTGLMVVAKQLKSHAYLVDQIQKRYVNRQYTALVHGELIAGGKIDAAISRHPANRKKMHVNDSGKQAVTHYRIKERFNACTLLEVTLETGRTHQIRVHMTHINYPIVGDPVYFKKVKASPNKELLKSFSRQALHASKLALIHPVSNEAMEWTAPIPDDFQKLLDALE